MTTQQKNQHVVIIGAGIIGSSIAFNLAERGVQVTIIDADEPGQGASSTSFAWINGRDKNPRFYHDLNRRSVDMWSRFARRLGDESIVTWGGELRWAATNEGADELRLRVKDLQSWGYPIRLLAASEVKEMEPKIATGDVKAASYTSCDGHVDTGRAIRSCLRSATEQGAKVLTGTPINQIQVRNGKVAAVVAGDDEIACDAVVLATGPDTPQIAQMAGIDVPLHHTFGATIITEATSPIFQNVAVIHTPRDAPQPQINVRQFQDGSVMVHGGSHGTSIDRSLGESSEEIEQVLEKAVQFLPALKGVEIKEIRKGRRPVPNDGLPILGFAKAVPNIYIAAMHSGATLAALVGEFAATEIVDGARIDILQPYRLERFA